MGIDQVKVWFTYAICAFVVVGGFGFLYAIRADATVQNGAVSLAVVGFVASSLTFLYGQVVQSQTAHQTNVAASTLTGAAPTAGTTTTTTTTATPEPAP
jgi:hypothetical protein